MLLRGFSQRVESTFRQRNMFWLFQLVFRRTPNLLCEAIEVRLEVEVSLLQLQHVGPRIHLAPPQ